MLAQTTQSSLQSTGWVLDDPNIMALLEKLKSIGQSLGDFVGNKIYRGIVTGHNESFVIDRATRDELITADPKSADVIKPFLRGRDVKRWKVQFAEKYIILVKRGFPLENYPAIKKRLEGFKKPLSSRATIHTHPWYELQQPQEAYHQALENPKIVYPDIAQHMNFSWDDSGMYGSNTLYFLETDKKWLTGVLNSGLMYFIYTLLSVSIQGGFLRFFVDYLEQLPIVQPNPQQQAILESITDDSRITELNAVVYQMYGLTLEEIALVEAHTAGVVVGAETDLDEE
jgi:adenine-specific DNA-methyltransferase